jgi:YgiT-type zinc finger domain-containing protein
VSCVICTSGEVHPGLATVTLQRGETTLVIKGVPANVCNICEEYYLSEEMTRRVLELAEASIRNGAEVEILRWAA